MQLPKARSLDDTDYMVSWMPTLQISINDSVVVVWSYFGPFSVFTLDTYWQTVSFRTSHLAPACTARGHTNTPMSAQWTRIMTLWRRISQCHHLTHSPVRLRTMRRRKQYLLARFKTLSTLLLTFVFCSSVVIFRSPSRAEIIKPFCPHHSLGALIVNEVSNSSNGSNGSNHLEKMLNL